MKTTRIAVSTFFFVNGFIYANWTSRLPELQSFYQISDSVLGSLLFMTAAGSLIAMPFTGWLTTKFGSKRIVQVTAFLFCIIMPTLALFHNEYIIASIFFAQGMITGSMDVAINGQAVFVERTYKKPIMSSFHALFSVGMVFGAITGAIFAKLNAPLFLHFCSITLPSLCASIYASFYLIEDKPNPEKEQKNKGFQLPTAAILLLGLIAFCSMTGEGSMADWSAIFMNKVVGENEFFSALAFGTFCAAMTLGRIFGDYFTARIGKYKLLIYNSIIAITGLAIALIFATTWTTVFGFFLIGLGLSTIVPIVYSTAGNTKGVEPSVGIAMATSIGYAGFFIGPPVIGFLSDWYDLRVGLSFTLFLFFIMFVLSIIIKNKK